MLFTLTCSLNWRCNTTRIHLSPVNFCLNNKSNVCYLYKSEITLKNATNSQQCYNLKLGEWSSRQTLLNAGTYCAKHQNFRSPVAHTNVIGRCFFPDRRDNTKQGDNTFSFRVNLFAAKSLKKNLLHSEPESWLWDVGMPPCLLLQITP